jgi:hypothetical protein
MAANPFALLVFSKERERVPVDEQGLGHRTEPNLEQRIGVRIPVRRRLYEVQRINLATTNRIVGFPEAP